MLGFMELFTNLLVLGLDANRFGDGAVLGCDFVGTVEEKGSNVTRADIGDVVARLIRGGKIYTFSLSFECVLLTS